MDVDEDEEDGDPPLADGEPPAGGTALASSAIKFSCAILNSASNRSLARTTFDWR